MSSEIQFGDIEQNEPQKAVRPDRDAHYCIAAVGEIDPVSYTHLTLPTTPYV